MLTKQIDFKDGKYDTEKSCPQLDEETFEKLLNECFEKGFSPIVIEGYTPYFNDGEPCVYRLYFADEYRNDEGEYVDCFKTNTHIEKIFDQVPNGLDAFEDIIQENFGDHAHIFCYPDRYVIYHNDHD